MGTAHTCQARQPIGGPGGGCRVNGEVIAVAGRLGTGGAATAVAVALAVVLAPAGGPARAAAARTGGLGPAGTISTVAGGAGGPALGTRVSLGSGAYGGPCAVSFGAGRVYVAAASSPLGSFAAVRALDPETGILTPVAGTGVSGPLGDGRRATRAAVQACGTAVDGSGNLVIAGTHDNRIRVVAARTGTFYGQPMTKGDIYTVAGTGHSGFWGDGGPATRAAVNVPLDVAFDPAGNLLIADTGNNRIRVVAESTGTFYGRAMTAGDIYPVAGGGTGGLGDGGPARRAQLAGPAAVIADRAGNLVIADSGDNRIRVVAESTGTFYGRPMTAGRIYTVAGNGTQGFRGEGTPATRAELSQPSGVAVDAAGNLVIADGTNCRVRVVAESTATFYGQAMTAGHIYTVAGNGTPGYSGDGGPAISADLSYLGGVTVDGAGNLVIADVVNNRVRVVAASTGTFYGQAMTAGHIYTGAGNGDIGYSGQARAATTAQFFDIADVAVSHSGNLVLSDLLANQVNVVAAATGTYYGQAMTAGDIYRVAGNGRSGYSGVGGPAKDAEMNLPTAVAVDAAGNLVISDLGNARIRVVAAVTGRFFGRAMTAGHIYTIAGDGSAGYSGDGGPALKAALDGVYGLTMDPSGNLVLADTPNHRIRVVAETTGTFYGRPMTAGDIYTIAGDGNAGYSGDGGPATAAKVSSPVGVAFDASGNLVLADAGNNRIRVVAATTGTFYGQPMTAGDIYTIAGNGNAGFSGDGGPATSAELNFPSGIALDSSGNVIVADEFNNRIRVVAENTGTFYGQAMTAGDIYTIAGNGTAGFAGDGGPATSAELNTPIGVAMNGAGDVAIADDSNNRIRMVAG